MLPAVPWDSPSFSFSPDVAHSAGPVTEGVAAGLPADGVAVTVTVAAGVAEPEEPQPQLQAVLFVKVVLALMSGRPADAYLDAQREVHLARMREIATRRRGAGQPEALLADYELFHIEADLRWIEHAAQRLDTVGASLS